MLTDMRPVPDPPSATRAVARSSQAGQQVMMTKAELRNHHEREAGRLRLLLAGATTAGTKAWLARQVEEHERLARGEAEVAELETTAF